MSRDLADLQPNFRESVRQVLEACRREGVIMRPFFTLRHPEEQAKLWRQSRSTWQIKQKVAELREAGADFLAECIMKVGPQNGRWATNAIPGYSWHQWGQAVDCFWLVDGEAVWSTSHKENGINGYHIYAEIAQKHGLTSGLFWSNPDGVHIQGPSASAPSHLYNLREIDLEMRKMFG